MAVSQPARLCAMSFRTEVGSTLQAFWFSNSEDENLQSCSHDALSEQAQVYN